MKPLRLPLRLALLATAIPTVPASAADIVVDTAADGIAPTGACRLRHAIEAANTDAAVGECSAGNGADRIVFDDVAVVTLRSELDITAPLKIDGERALVTLRRDPHDADAFRILDVSNAATLTLRRIAIESGRLAPDDPAGANGAGIRSDGRVVLEHSRVAHNHSLAESGSGGGIFADEVHATRSRVTGNSALDFGGGIFAQVVTLIDSQVDGNTATEGLGVAGGVFAEVMFTATGSTLSENTGFHIGGGVYSPIVTLRNSTVSGNRTGLCGGGVGGRVVSIQNCTITANAANDNASGGICAVASDDMPHSLSISNSIVRGNLGDIGTIIQPVDVAGEDNIIGAVGGNVSLPADTVDCDPGLAPLADNGGPTSTHAIASAGCAEDAGSNPFALATDQRGEPRTAGAATDIGAYELQPDALFGDGFE